MTNSKGLFTFKSVSDHLRNLSTTQADLNMLSKIYEINNEGRRQRFKNRFNKFIDKNTDNKIKIKEEGIDKLDIKNKNENEIEKKFLKNKYSYDRKNKRTFYNQNRFNKYNNNNDHNNKNNNVEVNGVDNEEEELNMKFLIKMKNYIKEFIKYFLMKILKRMKKHYL